MGSRRFDRWFVVLAVGLGGCEAPREAPPMGQEREVLLAAAEYVRARTDSAFVSYIDEAAPRDYAVHLAPDSFPLPGVLGQVALRIRNATYGPIDTTCAGATCRITPDVPVIVMLKNLELPRPDSATLEMDVYIQPFERVPYGYWRLDRFYLVRRGALWTVIRVETREEA